MQEITNCNFLEVIRNFLPHHDNYYLSKLSRGRLLVPSEGLSAFVSQGFALLDVSSSNIQSSSLPSRYAAEKMLPEFINERIVHCDVHNELLFNKIIRIISNIFLNKRKKTTDSIVKDKVAAFKRSKRDKNFMP